MVIINPLIKKIYKKIKQYDEIVIARHIGPDPDAIASQISLRDSIKATFPNKKVYAVGTGVAKFKTYGLLDKIDETTLTNALLITLDVPNFIRADGVNKEYYQEIFKIDHHPSDEVLNRIDWVDDTASSTCQLIIELILNSKLKLTDKVSENLFLGVVSDSDRFLLPYTTTKTFDLISKLIKESHLDFTSLYKKLYLKPINEVRFHGFISDNLEVTENGLAFIKISNEDIQKYGVDTASASNMINDFNYINDVYVWIFITYDEKNDLYKINIRSRGPVINEIAAKYNGGGHMFASGVRTSNAEDIDKLIKDLDEACLNYKSINK